MAQGFRSAASSADLLFICQVCGESCDFKTARNGCSSGCARRLFRVARSNFPLIENPQHDPYRKRDTQEDGYQFTTQGGDGTISGNALGQNRERDGIEQSVTQFPDENVSVNDNLPSDQDAFDASASPEPDGGQYPIPQSPALTDSDSPLNPINYKEPRHTGPHNMPHGKYNGAKEDSVFDRVRRLRKD